jgi:hypothetical protein
MCGCERDYTPVQNVFASFVPKWRNLRVVNPVVFFTSCHLQGSRSPRAEVQERREQYSITCAKFVIVFFCIGIESPGEELACQLIWQHVPPKRGNTCRWSDVGEGGYVQFNDAVLS